MTVLRVTHGASHKNSQILGS